MEYLVQTSDGQQYGPVDFPMLIQWKDEGRIEPNTLLIDSLSGRSMMANQLPGLGFPPPGDYYQGVQPSPKSYPKIVETKGDKMAATAKALGIVGFFFCPLFCLVGIVFAALAYSYESYQAKTAMMICVGSLLLQALILGIYYAVFKSGPSLI